MDVHSNNIVCRKKPQRKHTSFERLCWARKSVVIQQQQQQLQPKKQHNRNLI